MDPVDPVDPLAGPGDGVEPVVEQERQQFGVGHEPEDERPPEVVDAVRTRRVKLDRVPAVTPITEAVAGVVPLADLDRLLQRRRHREQMPLASAGNSMFAQGPGGLEGLRHRPIGDPQ
ncbi:hypothetical protein BRC93_15910 [Halobacteriales archaeon QS_5_70_15]|nr:MAG: hypothetical protein BRC93_15910 [Halobacteriales archaeon QS_5_70_15]